MHPAKFLRPPKNRQSDKLQRQYFEASYVTNKEIIAQMITLSKRLDRAEYLLGPLARPRGALDFWAK